jgi:hypothetical protein
VDQVGRVILNAPFAGKAVAASVSEWTVEPNQHRILQEVMEVTEEMTFPLITPMSADWMLQNPRPSALHCYV